MTPAERARIEAALAEKLDERWRVWELTMAQAWNDPDQEGEPAEFLEIMDEIWGEDLRKNLKSFDCLTNSGQLKHRKRHGRALTYECGQCGTRFEPARKDARYCSGACRQKAYNKRKRSCYG